MSLAKAMQILVKSYSVTFFVIFFLVGWGGGFICWLGEFVFVCGPPPELGLSLLEATAHDY